MRTISKCSFFFLALYLSSAYLFFPNHSIAVEEHQNYFAMKRFVIAESLLPANVIFIDRPAQFYERYKAESTAAVSAIIILSAIIAVLAWNITQRRKLQSELQASVTRFRHMFDGASDAIFIHDRDGRIVDVNLTACKSTGYNRDELLHMSVLDVEVALTPDELTALWNCVLQGNNQNVEGIHRRRDASMFPVEIHISPITLNKKTLFFAAARDITDRRQAEFERTKSEERFTKLFMSIPAIISFSKLDNGCMLNVNKEFEKVFEYSQDEIMGRTSYELGLWIDDKDRERITKLIQEEGSIRNIELKLKSKSGMIHTFRYFADSFEMDNTPCILSVFVDVTEQKKIENMLQESQANIKALIESTQDLVWSVDTNYRLLTFNDALLQHFTRNYGTEASRGSRPQDFLPADRAAVWPKLYDRAIAEGPYKVEYNLPDGKILELSFNPMLRNSDVIGVSVFGKDITEQKSVQRSLQISEERFRHLFEYSPFPIAMFSFTDNEIPVIFNNAFVKTFRYTNDDIKKVEDWHRLAYPDPEYYQFTVNFAKDAIRRYTNDYFLILEPWDREITCKDGSVRSVHILHSKVGNFYQSIFVDMTDRIKAEAEKERLQAQLLHAQKMEAIGTLAGGIAHDFNNILAGIMGYIELTLEHHIKSDHPAHGDLSEALKATFRARDLVSQMMTFSRQQEQKRESMALAPLLKEALKLLRSSIPAMVEIHQDITASQEVILAEPAQMHQVIMNLCVNAAHAMKEKGGLLEVSLRNVPLGSDVLTQDHGFNPEIEYLELMVRDTGHGMSKDIKDRIFDPFFTTKKVGEGTGLGLAVVYGIVKNHDGVIMVESEPGRGTEFKIYFPLIKAQREEEIGLEKDVPGGRERIIFVDDDVALTQIFKMLLEKLGYTVAAFNDPRKVVEAFDRDPAAYDLLITDLSMPHMNGTFLAEEVNHIRPDVPIILCSGTVEINDPEHMRQIGIQDSVRKPISIKSLAAKIRQVLDRENVHG